MQLCRPALGLYEHRYAVLPAALFFRGYGLRSPHIAQCLPGSTLKPLMLRYSLADGLRRVWHTRLDTTQRGADVTSLTPSSIKAQ